MDLSGRFSPTGAPLTGEEARALLASGLGTEQSGPLAEALVARGGEADGAPGRPELDLAVLDLAGLDLAVLDLAGLDLADLGPSGLAGSGEEGLPLWANPGAGAEADDPSRRIFLEHYWIGALVLGSFVSAAMALFH